MTIICASKMYVNLYIMNKTIIMDINIQPFNHLHLCHITDPARSLKKKKIKKKIDEYSTANQL